MKIFVRVKTNAPKEHLETQDVSHYLAAVREAPVDGKANRAVIRLLALHLGITPSRLKITRGIKSRQKTISADL